MKKIFEITFQLWNWIIIYWNLNFLIRNVYLRLDVEVFSAIIIVIIFSYFLYNFYRNKYFIGKFMNGRYLLINFLIGLACIFFDVFIVFCTKLKGLSFG